MYNRNHFLNTLRFITDEATPEELTVLSTLCAKLARLSYHYDDVTSEYGSRSGSVSPNYDDRYCNYYIPPVIPQPIRPCSLLQEDPDTPEQSEDKAGLVKEREEYFENKLNVEPN